MTHCGVLEFVADEGICYLPHWVYKPVLFSELYWIPDVHLLMMFVFALDDAESAVGRGGFGPGGERQSHGGHILQISAPESRLSRYHEPQSCVSKTMHFDPNRLTRKHLARQ